MRNIRQVRRLPSPRQTLSAFNPHVPLLNRCLANSLCLGGNGGEREVVGLFVSVGADRAVHGGWCQLFVFVYIHVYVCMSILY